MRTLVRRAFDAALAAVDAERATRVHLTARPIAGPVHVLALGKAASAMTVGASDACDVVRGLIIAPTGARGVPGLDVLTGSHPVPDAGVALRGESLLERAAMIPATATALVLLSGGGSALADAPIAGVTADDLADITRRLLASGATIEELNAIRVALSRSKGGGLARALRTRNVRVLVVNDIAPDGDPALVSSGPMSAWRGPRPADVIARAHVRAVLTRGERERIARWSAGPSEEADLEVVADNADAVRAARGALIAAGRDVGVGPALRGEARDCARAWVSATTTTAHDALVSGGETVVTVRGDGRGGRSQELALAALVFGIGGTFLAAGTDGIDGMASAAGAVIDDALRVRVDPAAALRALDRNDAGTYLESLDALVVTGPTGTNVADLAIWTR